MKSYVIVLLGYSANDPPIRYLLEGLHARSDLSSKKIFTFDQGSEFEVSNRWRDRGVIPLAYPKSDTQHSALWDTLDAWANRADDPEKWRHSILSLASNDPKKLKAHERGQVASLVRTTEGAKLFANAVSTPPAEWICVFDRFVRYGESKRPNKDSIHIDPLAAYGLDDDPPRPRNSEQHNNFPALDILSTASIDELHEQHIRLAGLSSHIANSISPRLFHLTRWLARVLDQPASLWWAAGYESLHSRLVDQIEFGLNQKSQELSSNTRDVWQLLLQRFSSVPNRVDQQYHIVEEIKRDGWSPRMHRKLEQAILPYMIARRPFAAGPVPPSRADNFGETASQLVSFEVEFPVRGAREITIPSEHLHRGFRSVRRGLERACELLSEIDTRHWHTASFETDGRPGERHLRSPDIYLHWAKDLFERLAIEFPEIARSEIQHWPNDDSYFFDKLKIYAWGKHPLVSGDDAAAGLLGLSDDGFWNSYHRRELLTTLKAQWSNIPPLHRSKIENRIISGSALGRTESKIEGQKRKSSTAATILSWLEDNGCALSEKISKLLPKLRTTDPRWNPRWAQSAADSLEGRVGYVEVRTEPTKIIDLPISDILDGAELHSSKLFGDFTEYRPFSGLVAERPQRALAALAYQSRLNNYPIPYWRDLLSNCPKDVPHRLQSLFAHRIARLPERIISEMPHEVARWVRAHLPQLIKRQPANTLAIWDQVLTGLVSGGESSVKSGISDISMGGKSLNLSRRTYGHAINGPVGVMAETLFSIIDDLKLSANAGIPKELRDRLERLFVVPGEGCDHAICETTIRLNWLFYIDENWVSQKLIPMFGVTDSRAEPAWNGYLHSDRLCTPDLFALLKADFLKLFECYQLWAWDDQPISRLNEFLVIACYWNLKSGKYVSYADARRALQQATNESRSHAIWFLGSIISQKISWNSFGKPFVINAWPREIRFQTAASSRQLASIARDSGDNFPSVVATISQFLVPSEQLDLFIYQNKDKDGLDGEKAESLPRRFPRAMLELLDPLVPDDPKLAPYDLGSLIDILADAEPSLRQDARWRRLSRIAHSR